MGLSEDGLYATGIVIGSLIFVIGVSFLLASAGEPQSSWFWCDVLRVCP